MKILKLGDSGSGVEQLQNQLKQLGVDIGIVDGQFGQKTKLAVEEFQKKKGLSVDGIVGDATLDELFNPSETPLILGIDTNQGSINWQAVKNANISFAFIKATEGGDWPSNPPENNWFESNWPKMKQAGLIRGAYHFFVGKPGKSDHQNGASLDIEEWDLVKDLITQPKYEWEWTYGMDDRYHFDYKKDIQDIKDDTVKAFQTLWNKANSESEQLEVDGNIGNLSASKTLKCIDNSPAEGFPNVGYPRTLKLTEPIQEGKDIGELQLALIKAGIKLEKADQVFGLATDQAVKEFQQAHSLTVDGVVSAEGETRQALKPYLG
jgi:peptidoglycan hydrolase-like protein with peptidoglycan-binding domain